MKTNNKI